VAVPAEAEDVEAVTVGFEPFRLGKLLHGDRHASFEGRRWGDIDDLAAMRAQQVVVVLGELLRQLVAGELVIGRDPPDHPRYLQVEKVAIGRTAWQIGQSVGDVPDADRVSDIDEKSDDGSSTGCVPLVGATKSVFDDIVQVTFRCGCCHHALPSSRQWDDSPGSVLVVVAFMGSMAMSVVDVVDVSVVLHRLMSAVGTVLVAVAGMLDMGERMLVIVASVLAVGVTFVDVVDMSVVVDGNVATVRAVGMAVIAVDVVFGRGHGISFAWFTASATM
jgi:hypothetical protein